MDDRLIKLYEEELTHLRDMGAEFARSYPKIAERLGMEDVAVADPYVERLLEGFAFMAARVRLKLDAEFPRFTQHLLETIHPDALRPRPAMTVVEFQPDRSAGALVEGQPIPRGTELAGADTGETETRATFTTAHDLTMHALEVTEVAYHARDLGTLDVGDLTGVRSAIRVRLRTLLDRPISSVELDRLVFHLAGSDATPHRLYELLIGHTVGIAVHGAQRPTPWVTRLPGSLVQQVGFEPDEAMLPAGRRGYEGHRLLREYFALPQRFLFIALAGLADAFADREDHEVDVTILLDQDDAGLEHLVEVGSLRLHCTPAINLFERRLDRIDVDPTRFEYELLADRLHPADYEIHSIVELEGYEEQSSRPVTIEPFYATRQPSTEDGDRFFALHRVPRAAGEDARRLRRSHYNGSDVSVSIVDTPGARGHAPLRQLGGTVRCTNRDLALLLRPKAAPAFTCESVGAVESVRSLGPVTPPQGSIPEGRVTWALIGHLVPNYLGITETVGGDPAESLRQLLALYADTERADVRRQLEGVLEVSSQPIVRRLYARGGAAFARGLEVDVLLEENAFEGAGIFLLGAVLERFFDRHAAINVFTETVVRSRERGEVMRWSHRRGTRPIL